MNGLVLWFYLVWIFVMLYSCCCYCCMHWFVTLSQRALARSTVQISSTSSCGVAESAKVCQRRLFKFTRSVAGHWWRHSAECSHHRKGEQQGGLPKSLYNLQHSIILYSVEYIYIIIHSYIQSKPLPRGARSPRNSPPSVCRDVVPGRRLGPGLLGTRWSRTPFCELFWISLMVFTLFMVSLALKNHPKPPTNYWFVPKMAAFPAPADPFKPTLLSAPNWAGRTPSISRECWRISMKISSASTKRPTEVPGRGARRAVPRATAEMVTMLSI